MVRSISPNKGFSGHTTDVVISGDNFLKSPTSSTFRAFLDADPLTGVTWVDSHTLQATVPAGLAAGTKALVVENAYGKQGRLAGAFTVQTTPGAALAVRRRDTQPATVNVSQPITVTAQVKNAGSAQATGVVAALTLTSTDGASASVTNGPDPASVPTLAADEVTTFTWTLVATAAGTLTIEAGATGQDSFSSMVVTSDPVSVDETIQLPAGLTATVVAGRAEADVNQVIPATLTVANGGTATADLASVVFSPSGTATGASCTGLTPAMPQSVGAGESRCRLSLHGDRGG